MKKIIIILTTILFAMAVHAQQINMFSHYFYKPMIYNPAFTGYEDDITSILFLNRSQWSGFKGSPQLNMVVADGNLRDTKAGLGLELISDKRGLTSRVGGNLSYSYRLMINQKTKLLFGVSLGIIDQTMDYSSALVENTNDPTLFTNREHKTILDGNAGLALIWEGLELGIAVPQLMGNKVKYVDNVNVRSYYTEARHYMGSLKYKYMISKEKNISIAPQALVRFIPNTPFQFDGNINLDWQNKFWIGATYKSNYAIGANAGVCIHKRMYIGYSYDVIIGAIGKHSGISHELLLNFKIGRNKKAEVIPETVKETPEPEIKMVDNTVYEKKVDSLALELKKSQDNLKELAEKLDQQVKTQSQLQTQLLAQSQNRQGAQVEPTPMSANSNVPLVRDNSIVENEVSFSTNDVKEFKDVDNNQSKKGFYIIVGTFVYRDLAIAEAGRFVDRGFINTDRIYCDTKQYNYVYIFKSNSKQEIFQKVKEARAAGVTDLWVQILE